MDSSAISRVRLEVRELEKLADQSPADAAAIGKQVAKALNELIRGLEEDRRRWENAARNIRMP